MTIVLKISGNCMKYNTQAIFIQLQKIISKHQQIYIIIGWGEIVTQALQDDSIQSIFCDGKRVTTPAEMKTIYHIYLQLRKKIIDEAIEYNIDMRIMSPFETIGIIDNNIKQKHKNLSILTGNCKTIRIGAQNKVIFYFPLGILEQYSQPHKSNIFHSIELNQIININSDEIAKTILSKINPTKIIFVTPAGGIYNNHKIVSNINISEPIPLFINGGMKKKLTEIKKIFRKNKKIKKIDIINVHDILNCIEEKPCEKTTCANRFEKKYNLSERFSNLSQESI